VAVAATTPENRTFDPAALSRLLDGRYAEMRQEIRTVMCRPEFAPVVALPTGEYRQRVLQWARSLAAEGLTAPGFPERYARSPVTRCRSWTTAPTSAV
jgi:acyl-CoA oxidase